MERNVIGDRERLKLLRQKLQKIFYDYDLKEKTCSLLKERGFTVTGFDDIPKYILFSNSKFFKYWNTLLFFLTIYYIYILPLDIGLNKECVFVQTYLNIHVAISCSVSLMFVLNIIFKFFTAIYSEDNELIIDLKLIAHRYIKSDLIIDVISAIPFDLFKRVDDNQCGNPYDYSKIFFIIGYIRIIKLNQINKLIENSNTRFINHYKILKLLVFFFYMCHSFGCILVGKSRLVNNIYEYLDPAKVSIGNYFKVHTYSLFIGVALILGTDMGLNRPEEKIFIIIINILSLAITANIFGYVALLIDILSYSQVRALHEKSDLIKEYLIYEGVTDSYRSKINNFYNFMYSRQRMMFMKNNLYEGLNNTLLSSVKYEMWKNCYFVKDKLFISEVISPLFFGKALEYMQGKIYYEGDIIVEEGETTTDFYLVCVGSKCEVYCCGILMKRLFQGDYFGETAMFTSSKKRTGTVISVTTGDYLMIPGNMFLKLLMDFSNERNFFLNIAYKNIAFYDQIITPERFGLFITRKNEVYNYILHKNIFIKPKTNKNILWYNRKLYDEGEIIGNKE